MKFKKILLFFLVLIVVYISFEIYTSKYEFSLLLFAFLLTLAEGMSNFVETTSDFFNNITTSYPILCLIVLFVLSLLILYLILKCFFKKQKILLSFLVIIVLTLVFIRTIPDYSNKYGISLTTIFGKEKYKQGYCLKENRILLKEELYKRVILQYLEKKKAVDKKIDYYMDRTGKNEYYIDENFTIDNWEEYLRTNINNENFFSKDDLKVANLDELFTIDTKTNTAGFKKPILHVNGSNNSYRILFDDSFYLLNNGFIQEYIYLFLHSNKNYYSDKIINSEINQYKHDIKNKNGAIRKFDNCGNVDYDVEEAAKSLYYGYLKA